MLSDIVPVIAPVTVYLNLYDKYTSHAVSIQAPVTTSGFLPLQFYQPRSTHTPITYKVGHWESSLGLLRAEDQDG